jgi:3-hydroxyisobutyrate dehydrogenase-like beta-hydroxyacid dehydrogenase
VDREQWITLGEDTLEQAERVRQQLPLLEIHADVLEACVRHGEAELDNSAVIKEIRRRTRP